MSFFPDGRDREAIWSALKRREVYGTSGHRMQLWFDLVNPPGAAPGSIAPMGSEVSLAEAPTFRARALGCFEQKPGCPDESVDALGPEDVARLCRGECHNPSDTRRASTHIEIVRIRPQRVKDEPVAPLIQDPWQSIPCAPSAEGCVATVSDPDFVAGGRETLYYARAFEALAPTVNAGGVRCERGAQGNQDTSINLPSDADLACTRVRLSLSLLPLPLLAALRRAYVCHAMPHAPYPPDPGHTSPALRVVLADDHESGDAKSPVISPQGYRSMTSFRIPKPLLNAGQNRLVLELLIPEGTRDPHLGIVYAGEPSAVDGLVLRRWIAFQFGPMMIGVMLFALGLVSIGLWRGRRDGELFMLLALGSLLWSLQILMYQWPTRLLPRPHHAIIVMSLYAWYPALIGVFFLRFAYQHSRSLEAVAAALAILAAPVFYAAFYLAAVPPAEVERILAALEFEPKPAVDGVWTGCVPSFRAVDFEPRRTPRPGGPPNEAYPQDLYEEVLRHWGYHHLPATLPALPGIDAGSGPAWERRARVQELMAGLGFAEGIHFAFHDRAGDERLPALVAGPAHELANPLSDRYAVMRRSLVPNLVAAAEFNLDRDAVAVRLFEVGHLFPSGAEEVEAVAAVIARVLFPGRFGANRETTAG